MQSLEDPFKDWREMAASVGQTVSDGISSLAESMSFWLSIPFEDEESAEPDPDQQRTRSHRCFPAFLMSTAYFLLLPWDTISVLCRYLEAL